MQIQKIQNFKFMSKSKQLIIIKSLTYSYSAHLYSYNATYSYSKSVFCLLNSNYVIRQKISNTFFSKKLNFRFKFV